MCVCLCFTSQGEGVAYRGRVLIELSSKLDEKVEKRLEDVSSDDILLAQVRRDRLHLYCPLLSQSTTTDTLTFHSLIATGQLWHFKLITLKLKLLTSQLPSA